MVSIILITFAGNKKQMKQVLFFIIILFTVSCGVQKQLQKSYIGKPLSVLEEDFGKPKTILDQNGEKIYV